MINCDNCNLKFIRKSYEIKRNKFNYCSLICRNQHYKICRVGPGNPRWKGEKKVRKDGYIFIYKPSHPRANQHGYVFEHHLKMEEFLGRYLGIQEVIHHIDGNPSNNFIGNLMLLKNQAEHASIHMKEIVKSRKRNDLGQFV